MLLGSLTIVPTDSRPWRHPDDGMQNARTVGPGKFPQRFEMQARKAKQGATERPICEDVGMKSKGQWRPQDVGDIRN